MTHAGGTPNLRAGATAFHWQRALNVLPLIAYRGLTGGLPILIGLYIGHRWGLVPLGAYTYASSFAAVGLVVTDWGCQRWLPRELALVRNSGAAPDAVRTANTLRLCLAALYFAFMFALFAWKAMDVATLGYAAELGILYFVAIFSTNAVSDRVATDETAGIGAAVATGLTVFALSAFAAERLIGSSHALVGAYVAGKIAESAVLVSGRTDLLRFVSARVVHLGKRLWPFSIQAVLAVIYARLSVFVIEHLRSMTDVGIIGAASALQNVLLLLPTSMALLVYPKLATAANAGDEAAIPRLVRRYAAISATGIAAGVAVIWAARTMISGALHVPPAYAMFLVAFVSVALLTSFTVIAGVLLQAMNREVIVARLSFVTLALAIVYQYFFIRSYGVWGAALAIGMAEFTSLAVFGWALAATTKSRASIS